MTDDSSEGLRQRLRERLYEWKWRLKYWRRKQDAKKEGPDYGK